jgi:hypothetical protein
VCKPPATVDIVAAIYYSNLKEEPEILPLLLLLAIPLYLAFQDFEAPLDQVVVR